MEPSMDEWKSLYEAAVAFRDAAPWRWMSDADVFGVQDPESEQIGYCCVMGQAGEHFALGAYLGSEGLAGYWQMRESGPEGADDPGELLAVQDCVMASFEDRGMLRKQDLEVIKALGLKFRGRNAWPEFRRYMPGYHPWFLTAPEARFLTVCLPQALDVAHRFRGNPAVIPEAGPSGPYLVRVPERRGPQWVWKDTLQRPAPVPRAAAPVVTLPDEARLRHLRESLPATRGVLEIDYFYSPATIKNKEDERPWHPQVILAVDADSGLILTADLARQGDTLAALVKQLLGIVEGIGMRPARVNVRREEARAILKPVGDRLGIRVVRTRRLPALAQARREMEAMLGMGTDLD